MSNVVILILKAHATSRIEKTREWLCRIVLLSGSCTTTQSWLGLKFCRMGLHFNNWITAQSLLELSSASQALREPYQTIKHAC